MIDYDYEVHVYDHDLAYVIWRDGKSMTIALNPGDADLIRDGLDPVAEGWEDGCGKLVCYENAKEVE